METYLQPWKKYAQFSGRASRREYWTFTLINTAIYIGFAILGAIVGGADRTGDLNPVQSLLGLIQGAFWLAALIPGLAVAVRRLHDTNRSGWWLIPCMICGIILLVFGLQEGDMGPNQYGPDPYDDGSFTSWNLKPPPPDTYTDLTAHPPTESWRTSDGQ